MHFLRIYVKGTNRLTTNFSSGLLLSFFLSFSCPVLLDIYQNPVWFGDLGHTVHFNLSIWEINLWKNELKPEVGQLECRPADRLTVHGGLMRTHPQVNGTKADRLHCPVCWLESITPGSCTHIFTIISPHAAKAVIQKKLRPQILIRFHKDEQYSGLPPLNQADLTILCASGIAGKGSQMT